MFNELYKNWMDNIKPDDFLIQKTKNIMHKELKKKPKNFHKYVATAACLIITFSLIKSNFHRTLVAEDTKYIGNTSSIDGHFSDSNNINNLTIPNSDNFIQAGGTPFAVEDLATLESSSGGVFGTIINWIKEIVECIGNLFK